MEQFAWTLGYGEIWKDIFGKDAARTFFSGGAPEVPVVMEMHGKLLVDRDNDKTTQLKQPCRESNCKYHKHVDTEKCKVETTK